MNEPRVQELYDRQLIIEVLYRYAKACDTKDFALLATCFTLDLEADYGFTAPVSSYAALEALFKASLTKNPVTQHYVTNPMVDVDGDTARTSSYVIARHILAGAPGGDTWVAGGRYEDEFVRTAAGWRIRRRVFRHTWGEGNPDVVNIQPAQLAGSGVDRRRSSSE